MIDFRSDTVTIPTEEMRRAMAEAIVGDDVFGDDATVNRLEIMAAQVTGKQAAVFVPSGSFGNQLALLTHTRRADEVICAEGVHIVDHELGAAGLISGVTLRAVSCADCMLRGENIRRLYHDPNSPLDAETGLVWLENALSNGRVMPLDIMQDCYDTAKELKLPVHLDGARVFNAAAALGCEVAQLTACCDTVMFCLSKGLGAPIGSVLCGDADFIKRARKNRKRMGGAMRQVGVIAAAGIIALEKMSKRIAEDHETATYLAARLSEITGFSIIDKVDINMVFVSVPMTLDQSALVEHLKQNGILVLELFEGTMRFVTHHQVTRHDVDRLVQLIKDFLAA